MINHVQFPNLGIEVTINRVAFSVFGFDIYWYGVIFAFTIIRGASVAIYLGKKLGINDDDFIDMIMLGTVFGIIGARAYYVAFAPFEYETLWDMINLRDGGIGIYGGLIAGLVSGWFLCKWKKINFFDAADCIFTGFLFGQTFGRWANFMNQEAFGTNTDGLFGMISESTTRYLARVAPSLARQGITVDPNMPVHPTFLYESVWCAIGFIILYRHFKNRKFRGEMLCMSGAWYGFGRFFIEGLRTDSLATNGGLRTSQIIAVVTVAAAVIFIVFNYIRLNKKRRQEKMDNKLISGKVVSAQIKEQVKQEVAFLNSKGVYPKLSVIIVGENPASQSYVKGKHKDCAECGIISDNIAMPETISQAELLAEIERLNNDESVHGILVQLPLPKHIDEYAVINAIAPEKDVDGFTAVNVGNMNIGKDCFTPCTPQGCIDMLDYAGVELAGKDVVVIGRSNIVGKPVAVLALQRSATVTICHSKTKNIAEKTRMADIVIVAVGRAGFLTGDMLKPGAVVIDVGINRNSEGKLCGDADFDSCIDVVSKITPVPGGVGLMTRANLLKNTIKSAKRVMVDG